MPSITQSMVNALKPGETTLAVNDDTLKGFRVLVYPTGKVVFGVRYRVGGGRAGKQREAVIGTHPATKVAEARRVAADYLAKAGLGEDPLAPRDAARQSDLFADVLERFIAEHVTELRSAREVERIIRREIEPRLGRLRVADIDSSHVAKMRADMKATPVLFNRTRAWLSKIMNECETWKLRPLRSNPCERVKRFKEEGRDTTLTPDELARLGESLRRADRGELQRGVSPFVTLALRLILLSGARKSEIMGLRWEDVDFSKQTIDQIAERTDEATCATVKVVETIEIESAVARLATSKTGKKSLFLGPHIADLLRRAPRLAGNDFICCGAHEGQPLKNINKAWELIRDDAKLQHITIHDLRHAYASIGVNKGVSLDVVGKLLGHSDPRMTKRYARYADAPLLGAAGDIGSAIMAGLGDHEE